MTRKEITLLLVLAAIQFIHIVDFMILMPLGPQLQELFDIDTQQFGFLVSAYSFSAGIFGFLGATYTDRYDRKRVLLVCFSVFTLGTLACSLAPSYGMLLLARILTGAFGGLISSTVLSIVSDLVHPTRRAQGMGIIMSAFSVSSVVGVPVGLLVASRWGWNMPFLALVFLAVLTMVLVMIKVPPVKQHLAQGRLVQSPLQMSRNVLADGNQVRALLLMMFLMLAQFSVIPFIPTYQVENIGFRPDQLFIMYVIGGLFSGIAGPLVGKFADRKGRLLVYTIFALFSLIPLFLITRFDTVTIPVSLVFTTLFFISSTGRSVPAVAMASSVVAARQRGSFMSVNNALQHVSLGLGAILGGLIVTQQTSGIHGAILGFAHTFPQVPASLKTTLEQIKAEELADGRMLHYGWVGLMSITFVLVTVVLARTLRSVPEPQPAEKPAEAPSGSQ